VTIRFWSASSLSLGKLADLFNRAYEGYVVPFLIDEEMDLGASVTVRQREIVLHLANQG
jgi:hypothetical protein